MGQGGEVKGGGLVAVGEGRVRLALVAGGGIAVGEGLGVAELREAREGEGQGRGVHLCGLLPWLLYSRVSFRGRKVGKVADELSEDRARCSYGVFKLGCGV